MAVIAGIDEAGLGPVLGPLVVSAAAFRVPDDAAGTCLWQALAGTVSRKPPRHGSALAVNDSKKLFDRHKPDGLAHLERAVLAVAASLGESPASLSELLAAVRSGAGDQLADYPWYAGNLPLPRCVDATTVKLAANALAIGCRRAQTAPALLWSEPLLAGEYNRRVAATNNKSTVSFGLVGQLLGRLCRGGGSETLYIHVDRQGGRMRYVPPLRLMFPSAELKVLEECDTRSHYLLRFNRREVHLDFCVGAEERHLPVALASMASKYIRELFMERLNAFWRTHDPDIAPTAGYHTDGNRFYEQISPHVDRLGIDRRLLYRQR